MSEKRNLVAQSLNFLKMQVHLLEAATREARINEIGEIVPLLGRAELKHAVDESIQRFGMQTRIMLELDHRHEGRLLLAPDQQPQVMFILQDALSNIRKHAEAQRVSVTIVNGRDFSLLVEDDGQGLRSARSRRVCP
ncbi:sensor histidine kinase [Caballeronia insecticola]|uniref:histidine kinase n=1 Tax=Caballeronia insecticola TaxID=758793 RepID=R4X196_9BURK|nr:signal transduction histidine kinase [Caballeronia insecticola]BAN28110.1 GAF sensor signal transduction histidine kinase [Caballeronia insecticola]